MHTTGAVAKTKWCNNCDAPTTHVDGKCLGLYGSKDEATTFCQTCQLFTAHYKGMCLSHNAEVQA